MPGDVVDEAVLATSASANALAGAGAGAGAGNDKYDGAANDEAAALFDRLPTRLQSQGSRL